jgi:hypothetical protein
MTPRGNMSFGSMMNPGFVSTEMARLTTDKSLSFTESQAIQRLINGLTLAPISPNQRPEHLLVTQKAAAALLSVSRVTIWRMKREGLLRSVEVLPGTWRYSYEEIVSIANGENTSLAN